MSHSGRRQLLLVEDDHDLRESLREVLSIDGYDVETAEHGQAALELLKLRAPSTFDVILADMMMPIMGGLVFIDQLQRRWPDANVPILVLTAADQIQGAAEAPGVVAVIRKPFGVRGLLDAIDRALR